ncbi:MAG: tRNA pseudouridine(54/55) synthase Pus10 [Candidatus Brockarchaeota archaeon]|nr:tRNA pseudouridine(54/55) synthase Pus10 [Candidatus Brockarchaeota archaeon]
MDFLETCKNIVTEYPLCDSCLGRQFASLDRGFGNKEKGRALKMLLNVHAQALAQSDRKGAFNLAKALAESGYGPSLATLKKLRRKLEIAPKPCYICSGSMDKLAEFAAAASNSLNGVECSTVAVGCRVPLEVEEKEDELKSRFKLRHGENIRYEVTREIGARIERLTGKTIDKIQPDVTLIVSIPGGETEVNINPVFFKGKYRKLVPGIPQTKSPWQDGRGGSIEEIIGTPLLEQTRGEGMKFHGAGREDADVRMTGSGRPFVIEIIRPKRRSVDLAEIQEKINAEHEGRLQVLGLSKADKKAVSNVKIFGEKAKKTYRAIIKLDREICEADLRKLEPKLENATIYQRTPTRVLKRRGDRVRQKRLYKAVLKMVSPDTIEAIFQCEGGLYIKELINGDSGRTRPSFSELAGSEAKCVELEVTDIEEGA